MADFQITVKGLDGQALALDAETGDGEIVVFFSTGHAEEAFSDPRFEDGEHEDDPDCRVCIDDELVREDDLDALCYHKDDLATDALENAIVAVVCAACVVATGDPDAGRTAKDGARSECDSDDWSLTIPVSVPADAVARLLDSDSGDSAAELLTGVYEDVDVSDWRPRRRLSLRGSPPLGYPRFSEGG